MKPSRRFFTLVAAVMTLGIAIPMSFANADTWSAWTERTAPAGTEDSNWVSVAYGKDIFVAVADRGTKHVMTSPDGVTWTARDVPNSKGWKDVTFGNDLFVAVSGEMNGKSNLIMTSPNGIDWTIQPVSTGTQAPLNATSIAYGGGKFVVVGSNYHMTSTDGITWTVKSNPLTPITFQQVAYGNGTFVIAGNGATGANRVATSTDGTTWTSQAVTAGFWKAVTYGGTRFVAVAGLGSNNVITSTDGVEWKTSTAGADDSADLTAVAYGKDLFVALASQSLGKSVFTSPDGTTWTARSSFDNPESASNNKAFTSVIYAKDTYVALTGVSSSGSTIRIMTSPDPLATAPTTTTTTTTTIAKAPSTATTPTAGTNRPLKIPKAFGPNARRIAKRAGVPIPAGAKVRMEVMADSKKICRVSEVGNLLSIKAGTCNILLSVIPTEGKTLTIRQSFNVS